VRFSSPFCGPLSKAAVSRSADLPTLLSFEHETGRKSERRGNTRKNKGRDGRIRNEKRTEGQERKGKRKNKK